jgi:hypothetical protein
MPRIGERTELVIGYRALAGSTLGVVIAVKLMSQRSLQR